MRKERKKQGEKIGKEALSSGKVRMIIIKFDYFIGIRI